jgi:hypothetical protein
MPTTRFAPDGHGIDFERPAVDEPFEEQLMHRSYVRAAPGPWARARCSCGWAIDGDAPYVAEAAREHVSRG